MLKALFECIHTKIIERTILPDIEVCVIIGSKMIDKGVKALLLRKNKESSGIKAFVNKGAPSFWQGFCMHRVIIKYMLDFNLLFWASKINISDAQRSMTPYLYLTNARLKQIQLNFIADLYIQQILK